MLILTHFETTLIFLVLTYFCVKGWCQRMLNYDLELVALKTFSCFNCL